MPGLFFSFLEPYNYLDACIHTRRLYFRSNITKKSNESFIERLLAESQRNQSNSVFACHYAMGFLAILLISDFFGREILDFCSVTEVSVQVINQNMFTFFSLRKAKAKEFTKQLWLSDYSAVCLQMSNKAHHLRRMYHILTAVNAIIKMQFTKKEAKTRSFFYILYFLQFNIIKIHETLIQLGLR